MKRGIQILFFCIFWVNICAQSVDTSQVFTLDEYLTWVRMYHPLIQQAGLLDTEAEAKLLKARGGFDPKAFGEYDAKTFDGKNYFRVGEGGIKIPTWYGIDLQVSYTWTDGIFLNPENNLPINGQAVAKIEAPLLQGLLFDQRRAQVQLAQTYRNANATERQIIINDLLIQAIEAYWEWAFQREVLEVYQEAKTLASIRLQNIVESFEQGDKPAIDTVEATIQVQNRVLDVEQAKVDLETFRLNLSNFLWYKNLTPLEVTAQLKAQRLLKKEQIANYASTVLLQNLEQTHPNLIALNIKQEQLQIKERLQKEYFKPDLRVSYNFLGNGFNFNPTQGGDSNLGQLFTNNFKWGVSFNYPLLLRKERAGLQLIELEQLSTDYKLKNKRLEIENKVNGILQQIQTNQKQTQIQQAVLANYERLLDAENEKFRIGESSIFLLNNREQKLIDANLKLLKLQAQYQKLIKKLDWAIGQL